MQEYAFKTCAYGPFAANASRHAHVPWGPTLLGRHTVASQHGTGSCVAECQPRLRPTLRSDTMHMNKKVGEDNTAVGQSSTSRWRGHSL